MSQNEAIRLREDYLARLDHEMRAVPHGVAAEIRGGILEEFEGLDAAATTALIGRLGDPAAIATEAVAADAVAPVPVLVASPPPPQQATHTRGFAIIAALTLSFGGIVVPFVGWIVGAVLVCLSPLWRTGEKVAAILVPFAALVVSVILVQSMSFSGLGGMEIGVFETGGSSSGTGMPPEGVNPLVPAWYDLIWFGVIGIGLILIPASGLWLLWRLRGRRPAE